MDLNLQGKNAIVTGGSAGIGLACAKALYAEGVNVVIVARNREKLERAVEGIQESFSASSAACILPCVADLTMPDDISRVVKTARENFSSIDILLNNAGSAKAGAFLELEDKAFLDAWNLKLLGYIRMVKAVVPGMIGQGDGRILNIIGGAAHTPSATFLPGSTANAALLNFTKGLSKELTPHNVRINAISPGKTATARAIILNRQTAEALGITEDEAMQKSVAAIPLGRMVKPEEIANMALFLVSDLAASICGAEVIIDGGISSGI